MSQSSENSEKIKAEGRGGRRGRESGGVGVARAGPEEPGERRGRREEGTGRREERAKVL